MGRFLAGPVKMVYIQKARWQLAYIQKARLYSVFWVATDIDQKEHYITFEDDYDTKNKLLLYNTWNLDYYIF